MGFKGSYDTMSMEEKLEDLGVDPAEYRRCGSEYQFNHMMGLRGSRIWIC